VPDLEVRLVRGDVLRVGDRPASVGLRVGRAPSFPREEVVVEARPRDRGALVPATSVGRGGSSRPPR
jgi:hypothetical protein